MSGSRLHASCIVIDESGILIRGPSGSGKSTLAHRLLVQARLIGRFAALVSDDRVAVEPRAGRLLARAVPPIEGHLEVRGVGIVALGHEPSAVIRLVVDCGGGERSRLPDADDALANIAGIDLPRLSCPVDADLSPIVLGRLCGLCDTVMTM